MKTIIPHLIVLVVFTISCNTETEKNITSIPASKGITVDGKLGDWNGKGLNIPLYADKYGAVDTNNFFANCKLGWNDEGLLFAVSVQDDTLFEGSGGYHQNDGLEFFISTKAGTDKILQYLVSAGITKKYNKPQVKKNNFALHKIEDKYQKVTCASQVTKNGYDLELMIPFTELPDSFKQEDPLFIQFYVNDKDKQYGSRFKSSWHYFSDTYRDHFALKKTQLSPLEKQMDAHSFARAFTVDNEDLFIICFAGKAKANTEAVVQFAGLTKNAVLKDMGKYASCTVSFKNMDKNHIESDAKVYIDGQLVDIVSVYGTHQKYVNKTPDNRFEMDIRAFEKEDRNNPKPKDAVLFLGSSSIRMWKSLEDDFPGIDIINRGFGGSTNADALHFFDRIVKPYEPAKIVYFEGSNDLARLSPQQVTDSTEKFINLVKKELPGTEVILLSVKVSVSRKYNVPKVLETNKLLKKMAAKYDFVPYVDICPPLIDENNKVKHDLFSADSTHMNKKGYETWVEILRPVLLDNN